MSEATGGNYKYEVGEFGGFIIARRKGTRWIEIGKWCATEEEARQTVAELEKRDD
jgi:hypothetical protein